MIPLTPRSALRIEGLPAFTDNYLWLIHDGRDAAVVDPGDSNVVTAALARLGLRLRAILVTHHHPDHTGGVVDLKRASGATVYGPAGESDRIAAIDRALDDDDAVVLDAPQVTFSVLAVPGHTRGHIAYHAGTESLLFCGDTLFSAGCGRLFEGTPAQMHASLTRLAALPGQTQVFCAHEYTLSNLHFARAAEPDNARVTAALETVQRWRAEGRASVPSTIARERLINPFLRCAEPALRTTAEAHCGVTCEDTIAVFAALRSWKDVFRPR